MKLKKFNEMWDPMGSWSPKHSDNQTEKTPVDEPTEQTVYPRENQEDLSWDPKQLDNKSTEGTTREEVKDELIKRMKIHKSLNYGDNTEIRAEQLLNIHKVWLKRVLSSRNSINNLDSIVTSLIKSEENLRGGGPLSYRK